MYRADTIVACATAAGRAAIAIVRVSGPEAFPIADRLVAPARPGAAEPWRFYRATAVDPSSGEPIDDVLTVRMPGPRSYTGEDVVEIHCHGSPLLVEGLIEACTRAGARPAERGEFTRRAVLNRRMDLVQAEGVADLIDARVTGGARIAWSQLQGALSGRLAELRRRLLEVLADVEANVDFSDDELPDEDDSSRATALMRVHGEIEALLAGFEVSRRWRDGYRVVFTGRPNAGKSSLVNALLGHGRMLVSDEPGTTRDSVEEVVDLGGLAFVLTDTAGIRDAAGSAEALAIDRAREKLGEADIVVSVIDASERLPEMDRSALDPGAVARHVVALNKIDLERAVSAAEIRKWFGEQVDVVETCARTGAGCDRLTDVLRACVGPIGSDQRGATISRVRHRAALEKARDAIRSAFGLLRTAAYPELVCVELRDALARLAEITDPVDNEDVLDRIFAEFCIGK